MREKKISNKIFDPFENFRLITENSYIEARYNGPLYGVVDVAGAKNMVTKILIAALSGETGKVKIRNIPWIGEMDITLSLCKRLGVDFKINPDKTLELKIDGFKNPEVRFDSYLGNRVSLLFAGPVLYKLGKANISKPKGCEIGERKIDFHLAGFQAFGIKIKEYDDYLGLTLKHKEFKPATITLPFPSVGATENLLIIASMTKGVSVIKNAAIEPEILEMVKILQKSGVSIKIDANRNFIIKGGPHKIIDVIDIMPDRVEAFSWGIAALSTKGDIFVKYAQQDHLLTPLSVLLDMGAGIEIYPDGIRFFYKKNLKPIKVTTQTYPGFPTDFQQPLSILLSQCNGISQIHETIFENRFRYLERIKTIATSGRIEIMNTCPKNEPCRFYGYNYPHVAKINGPICLGKGDLQIDDLRAGFALLNAGILSEGIKIYGIKLLYRGYENIVEKMQSLGADVKLVI
ncbi:MAG: UDP-N-acetylglucosamine 1-carboxyvinyltransferase [Candidatus Parcubacteria bacterium]|nr:MAG: UDP-N-acetylglucosamine 1-carboxyvinyltransferase [Candidatus Parcubacteria bacterium]